MKKLLVVLSLVILVNCKKTNLFENKVSYNYFGDNIEMIISENGKQYEKTNKEFNTNDKSIQIKCNEGRFILYSNNKLIIDTVLKQNLNSFRIELNG